MTDRIRWTEDASVVPVGGPVPAWKGHVGEVRSYLFLITLRSLGGDDLALSTELPWMSKRRTYDPDPDKLRAEAERWLTEFVSSLGAVWPEDEYEFPDDDELLEVKFAAGTRVRFAHPDAGYPGEAEEAMKALTPGRVYTIAWADIGQSRTDLNLAAKGKSLGRFNSVLFEPVDDEAAPMAAPTRED